MSEELDSYLLSLGMALARQQLDVERVMRLLSSPEIVQRADGSNVQQLIRLSLMTASTALSEAQESAMVAEVGVLLSMAKPGLEIDFGLRVGVASAQSCALFAMFSVVFEQGNLPGAVAILERMLPSLKAADDRKGLLEVLCWLAVLLDGAEDYVNAADALSLAIGLLDDSETADALLDNSALDMVREDCRNVFSFPMLSFLGPDQAPEIGTVLKNLHDEIEAKSHQ